MPAKIESDEKEPLPKDLDRTQIRILEALCQMQEVHGKANTNDIAASVALSYSQTLRYLKDLAEEGHVERIGQRAGWRRAA